MRLASLAGKNFLILLALTAMVATVFLYPDDKKEHKRAYVDRAGTVLVRLSYPYLGQFHDGRAAFWSGGGCDWGYTDKTGRVVLGSLSCKTISEFSDGLALVEY